jgi:hypothetical protein
MSDLEMITILYNVRRLIGSLWAANKVITITEWFNNPTWFLFCLYVYMGPAIFDFNKRLDLLSVIQLSGWHCIKCFTLNKKIIVWMDMLRKNRFWGGWNVSLATTTSYLVLLVLFQYVQLKMSKEKCNLSINSFPYKYVKRNKKSYDTSLS